MADGALRVGFAGAGFIANVHAGILGRDGRVRVAAVFDPDERAAALFALKTGARATPSVADLLGEVDALYICSPNALHAALAVTALDAGLHVFSEKPMATSVEAAQEVLKAASCGRGVYQVGFNRRSAYVYRDLKALIERGSLVPSSVLLKMNRGELERPAWTGDPAVSGGFLYETPVHMLDLARFLFGEVMGVIVRARQTVYGELDDFSMLLTFESGLNAVLAASAHATWQFPFERVEVYGAGGTAATEEMDRITVTEALGGPARVTEYGQAAFEERWGYVEADRRFVDAVHGASGPGVSAEEAWRTTELVARCYRAAGSEQMAR